MAVIKVTASTMGVSSPASVAAGTGYYVYKGDQPYIPPAPAKPLPQNVKTIAGKQARIAKYIRLRLDDVDKYEAARQLGVTRSTRATYEKAFRAYQKQQQEGGQDA